MDLLSSEGLNLVSSTSSNSATPFAEHWPLFLAAVAIWFFEKSLRGRLRPAETSVPDCSQLVRRYAPEALGLVVCVAIAAALRSACSERAPDDPNDAAAWQEIRNQWPILVTADTLFALQAMLRLLLLLSAILRPSGLGDSVDARPLEGSTAFFYFLAGVARVWLIFESPSHALEGPLSGPVNIAFEVAALPLLAKLATTAFAQFRRSFLTSFLKVTCWLVGLAATVKLASENRLPLAEDYLRDTIFTLVGLLELLAAASCLLTTLGIVASSIFNGDAGSTRCRGAFAGFAHLALPIQQSLSMYFFLTAFDSALDKVSVGQPLVLLQRCGALELVLLIGAGIGHLVLAQLTDDEASSRHGDVALGQQVF
jgi:hypothetical protein